MSLKSKSEEDYSEKARELSKTKKEYENVMKAAVEENMGLKEQLRDTEMTKVEVESKWKQRVEREVQGMREEMEVGMEESLKKKWEQQMEKEIQVRSGKVVAAERKQWQAKGKTRSIETMSVGTQSDVFDKDEKKLQVEVAVQTEEEVTVQMKSLEQKKEGVTELDVVMEDRSDMYEDLSGYEDEKEDGRLGEETVVSPATSKQKVTKGPRVTKNKRTICPRPSG